jgi:aspartate dehydrogenase
MKDSRIKIGIVGCGAIGGGLARFIDKTMSQQIDLVGLYDIDEDKAKNLVKELKKAQPKMIMPDRLMDKADLIIEATQIDVARFLINEAFKRDKDIMVLSIGAFVKYPKLLRRAAKAASNLYVPSGAICGLDGLSSLKEGTIQKVTLTTTKSPKSLASIPYLQEQGIDVFKIKREKVVFRGDITKAIECFPKNINVAATIFVATRFDNIEVVIKVNPKLKRNVHHIEVKAKEASISIEVENMPSPDNPKTSYMTVLSAQSVLQKMVSNIKVGN